MSRVRDAARDFFSQLKNKPLAPIYLVHGEETYLLDRAVQQIIARALPEGTNDFNMSLRYGKDTSGSELLTEVETISFMAGLRVVVLRDLQEMNLSELEVLADYIQDPNPRTCLVFHAMTAERGLDGRKGIVKKLKKAATVGEFKAFYENDAQQFLARNAEERGLRLDEGAQAYLLEAVGTSLQGLVQALEKLELFLGPRTRGHDVSMEQVREIIADNRVHSVFDLTDALGERRIEDALHLLEGMLHAGEAPIKINAMIARHFRILARLHDPSVRGAKRAEAARAVGVSPFFLKDYQRHARQFSLAQIMRMLEHTLEIDTLLKSSKLDDRAILETFILDLAVTPATRGA